ncbi:MAG: Archaeosine synthase [Methanobacterium sp. PtaB.Bin024]|jgi:archaeosine synthase|nr:MAG: Archaeosine synthase [Methanobacterium sp. PtaB.Bin024]
MIKVLCTTETSLNRPEARRWRERMSLLDPLGEVVVVLPCSMRKPYSSSKSHHIFTQATKGLQEAILTSPFGVCPREMENTYPIQSYDVSTVGDWSQEEIKLTGECLSDYIGDMEVIAHVAHGYMTVCQEYLPQATFTCQDNRTTSPESMQNLKRETKKYKKIKNRLKQLHMLRSIARYQFNTPEADKMVPSDYKLRGRFDRRLMHEDEQIAVLHHDNGLYSLNIKGGTILNDIGVNWVEIDFTLQTNTLFAPGVVDAYPGILPKDEVVITRNGEVVGVGKAIMAGEEMKRGEKGVAVRVRHRVK